MHKIEQNKFRGQSWDVGFRAIYGGQVMAQSLAAAQYTVSEQQFAHSLHCYFLLPGDADLPVEYQVEEIRNGRSFSARRVNALQNDKVIFDGLISFQTPEPGLSHQAAEIPTVAPPESIESDLIKYERTPGILSPGMQSKLPYHKVLDMRTAGANFENGLARRFVWMRCTESLSDFALHQAALCYASDYYFLSTAVKAHGLTPANKDLRLASIDHALWFHRKCNFNDWLLYVTESPVSDHARAYVRGQIFQQNGTLVASSTQEGLMRLRICNRRENDLSTR